MLINRELILAKLSEKTDLLIPFQGRLSLPVIYRIYRKMQHSLKFPPIHVTETNIIVNGHHRYISSVLSDYDLEIVSNYPKPSFMNDFTWETVDFTKDDWDSLAKIQMLNAEDANYNGLKIEDVESIIR